MENRPVPTNDELDTANEIRERLDKRIVTAIHVILRDEGIGQDRLTKTVIAFRNKEKASEYCDRKRLETHDPFYFEEVTLVET